MENFVNPAAMRPPLPVTGARRPLSAQDWEDQRVTFEQLYSTEDRELPEIMDIMKRDYGFFATYVFL
jgi:hypothetical protein